MNHLKNFRKLDITTKKMISSNLAWNFRSAFKWRWIEFDEFKEYEPGEDSKHIDWLVSARENKLLSKRYTLEKSIKVFFVLDIGSSMEFWIEKSKKDTLIETFLLLALSSVENWDSVWALVFGDNYYRFFGHKKWKAHIFEIYKNIVEFTSVIARNESIQKEWNNIVNGLLRKNSQWQQSEIQRRLPSSMEWQNQKTEENQISLNYTLTQLSNIKLKNNLVFILTDNMSIENDKNLKVLSLKNDIIYVNIFDNFENTLDWSLENSCVLGFLGTKKESIFIDNLDERKKEEYIKLRKQKIEDLKKYLQSFGISYLKIDNLSNIYKEFFIHFNKI